jgi:hypothetical protein
VEETMNRHAFNGFPFDDPEVSRALGRAIATLLRNTLGQAGHSRPQEEENAGQVPTSTSELSKATPAESRDACKDIEGTGTAIDS